MNDDYYGKIAFGLGMLLLLYKACECTYNWSMKKFANSLVKYGEKHPSMTLEEFLNGEETDK